MVGRFEKKLLENEKANGDQVTEPFVCAARKGGVAMEMGGNATNRAATSKWGALANPGTGGPGSR